MNKYASTAVCTSNDQGEGEVEMVRSNSLIRRLLRLPEKKEVYVYGGGFWREKLTGRRAGVLKECEIYDVIDCHRRMDSDITEHQMRENRRG